MEQSSFTAFPFLYMTLAINKLNGCGLSNNVHRVHLPKKTKITLYKLQNYQAVGTSQNTSIINKGELVNL